MTTLTTLLDGGLVDPAIARIAVPLLVPVYGAAAVLAVWRIVRGPSILDRMIGSDVLLATLVCGLAGFVAFTGMTEVLAVLLALAALGFFGSVSVSRYVSRGESRGRGVIGTSALPAAVPTLDVRTRARDTVTVANTPSTEQVPEAPADPRARALLDRLVEGGGPPAPGVQGGTDGQGTSGAGSAGTDGEEGPR
ncbi:monovalent cation/H+ antiporter complex subunit F [Brevibacterium litoralis]|uniref:monovalent cation/H+ antiporter complex subunit F n=1 Tax=Brevibacterium litoralis TaxID=3138935 RepID=UPI0032EAA977